MKNLLNLGKALNKAEQKSVLGGFGFHGDCEAGIAGLPCYRVYRDGNGNVIREEGVCNNSQQCIF